MAIRSMMFFHVFITSNKGASSLELEVLEYYYNGILKGMVQIRKDDFWLKVNAEKMFNISHIMSKYSCWNLQRTHYLALNQLKKCIT